MHASLSVFAIADANPDLNRYIVFRGNRAQSNGGFFIGGSSDVLVEGNARARVLDYLDNEAFFEASALALEDEVGDETELKALI